MAEPDRSDRIEAVLASVGHHLVIDGGADVGAVSWPASTRPDWRHRLLAAALVLAAVSAAVVAVAPARRAVSGWLRAGNIEVEIDPDLTVEPALPAFIDGATPLDEDQLRAELGLPVPDVSGSRLGAPHAWWAPPEPGIVATWNEDATSLWVVRTEDTFPESLDKWAIGADVVTPLPGLGHGGFAIAGEHIFETSYRRIAAGSVVAWTDGDFTFRLDSAMGIDDLITVAESIANG